MRKRTVLLRIAPRRTALRTRIPPAKIPLRIVPPMGTLPTQKNNKSKNISVKKGRDVLFYGFWNPSGKNFSKKIYDLEN